jgi:toxin CcdB
MTRFDLYDNPSPRSRAKSPYLLDVQSDHLGSLISRVVIRLTRVACNYTPSKVAQDLAPIIEISGEMFKLAPYAPFNPARFRDDTFQGARAVRRFV